MIAYDINIILFYHCTKFIAYYLSCSSIPDFGHTDVTGHNRWDVQQVLSLPDLRVVITSNNSDTVSCVTAHLNMCVRATGGLPGAVLSHAWEVYTHTHLSLIHI